MDASACPAGPRRPRVAGRAVGAAALASCLLLGRIGAALLPPGPTDGLDRSVADPDRLTIEVFFPAPHAANVPAVRKEQPPPAGTVPPSVAAAETLNVAEGYPAFSRYPRTPTSSAELVDHETLEGESARGAPENHGGRNGSHLVSTPVPRRSATEARPVASPVQPRDPDPPAPPRDPDPPAPPRDPDPPAPPQHVEPPVSTENPDSPGAQPLPPEHISILGPPVADGLDELALEGADFHAAILGAWWSLVDSCIEHVPAMWVECVDAADTAAQHFGEALPDPAAWPEVPRLARDAGYRRTHELLHPGPAPDFDIPVTLPAWTHRLRLA